MAIIARIGVRPRSTDQLRDILVALGPAAVADGDADVELHELTAVPDGPEGVAVLARSVGADVVIADPVPMVVLGPAAAACDARLYRTVRRDTTRVRGSGPLAERVAAGAEICGVELVSTRCEPV